MLTILQYYEKINNQYFCLDKNYQSFFYNIIASISNIYVYKCILYLSLEENNFINPIN